MDLPPESRYLSHPFFFFLYSMQNSHVKWMFVVSAKIDIYRQRD
jgi:hypothetical protein